MLLSFQGSALFFFCEVSVIEFISDNYMKKITLNDISEHVHFSISYICRIFRQEMDMNLMTFINQVRVEKAKTLLIDKQIPLVDIAHLSGFEDQSYFTKVFKRIAGISPGKFRERNGFFAVGDEQ